MMRKVVQNLAVSVNVLSGSSATEVALCCKASTENYFLQLHQCYCGFKRIIVPVYRDTY